MNTIICIGEYYLNMKILLTVLMIFLFLPNPCFAELDLDVEHSYANELTFYMHFVEPNRKSYCATVNINAEIMLLEAVNSSCGSKPIDYEVIIKKDNSYDLESVTNKLFEKQSFTDPLFAARISANILGLTAQALAGTLKIEKAY